MVHRFDKSKKKSYLRRVKQGYMRQKALLLYLGLWCTILSWGQSSEYRLRHITNTDGLSNSSVNMIFQDKSQRMWFGTWDGLDRYDGIHIRSFFPSVSNPGTLSNNIIREMAELPDGTLFIATDRGIDSFDPETEIFTRYFSNIQGQSPVAEHSFHLADTPDGEILAIVDGHGVFALENGVFSRKSALKIRNIKKSLADNAGILWVLSEDGTLMRGNETVSSGVSFVFHDPQDDRIWIQDSGGYHRLGENKAVRLPFREIRDAGSDGTYQYLGTDSGLFRMNPDDGSMESILPDVPVLSVACGIQGVIWVGTDMQGVWQISRPQFDFGANTDIFGGNAVRCFTKGPSGKLAVGTKGSGIYLFSSGLSLSGHLTTRDGLLHNAVYCMEDDGELIWIGTDGKGLNYQDTRTGRIHTLQAPDSLELSSVYAIQPQGRDTLWVGTSGNGLYRLKLDRSKDRVRVSDSFHYTPEQLGSSVVYSLLPTLHGSMFVGTRGAGLQQVRKDSGELSRLRGDIDDDILCLARGGDASLWVGTSMGLYRYGQAWEDVTHYSTEEGLPSNTIHGILEDEAGGMWVSTNNGLARIHPESNKIITYQVNDGLQDNEFSDGAFYSRDGMFYFGGIKGFNVFNPLEVNKDSFMPNLVLDELYIDNERRLLSDVLKEHKGSRKLVLGSGNRSLSFLFVPVDYLESGQCGLAYRMLGMSDEWVQLRDSRVVSFTNFRPGNYSLQARCSNGEGEWSEEWFTLEIRKEFPLWQTPLAKLAYVLLALIVAAYILYRQRKMASERAERKKNQRLWA